MRTLRSIPLSILAVAALLACQHWSTGEAPVPRRPQPAAPPSAPREEPQPAPAPPVVEKRLDLCALAPGSTTGLRVLHAVRLEGRPDTLAVVDGRRVPLSEAIGQVRLARETTWFPARKPLVLPVTPRPLRYEIYDVERVIEPGELTYLGMADGLPLYAAAADVAPVKPELAKLLGEEQDLAKLLAGSAALRARLKAVDVLYAPLTATGCVFQPLLRMTP